MKKFNIECEMPERWIPAFCSMLKHMEYDGDIGHSEIVGLYCDGDGDFRPQFNVSESFDTVPPKNEEFRCTVYDAG